MSYESPAEHPSITDEERCYIEESIGESAMLMGPAEVRATKCMRDLSVRAENSSSRIGTIVGRW